MLFCSFCARQVAVGEECNCPAAVEEANLVKHSDTASQGQYFQQSTQSQQWLNLQKETYGQSGAYGQPTPYGQPLTYGQPIPYAQQATYGQQRFYSQPGMGYPLPLTQMKFIQPGKGLVKVSGIVMTAIAGLGVVFWVIAAINYFYCCGFIIKEHGLRMAVTALALAFGITGIIVSPNPRRGFLVLWFGASLLVYNIVTFAFLLIYGIYYGSHFYEVGVLLGYAISEIITYSALSVLFIIGGVIRGRSRV